MTLPDPTAWLVQGSYATTSWSVAEIHAEAGKKVEPLYTAQALRDVLEQAAQEATDAVAFNGGTVQMEAHVREAILKMIGEI